MSVLFHSIIERSKSFFWDWLVAVLAFLVIMFIINQIVDAVKAKIHDKYGSIEESEYNKKVSRIIWDMIYYTLMVFNFLICFQIIWLDVAILMWGISFGIGFAMQTTLSNMISGIMLITNPQFKTGKTIQLLGGYNIVVKIEKLSIRNCVFRLIDGRRLILPNKKVINTPMKLRVEPYILANIVVGVDIHTDMQLVKEVLRNTVNEHKYVMQKDQTRVNIEKIDENWIVLKVFYYIMPAWGKKSALFIASDLKTKIINVFKKENIVIPYPNQVRDFK